MKNEDRPFYIRPEFGCIDIVSSKHFVNQFILGKQQKTDLLYLEGFFRSDHRLRERSFKGGGGEKKKFRLFWFSFEIRRGLTFVVSTICTIEERRRN